MSNGKCRWVVLIPFLPLKTYVEHVIPHKSDKAGGMRMVHVIILQHGNVRLLHGVNSKCLIYMHTSPAATFIGIKHPITSLEGMGVYLCLHRPQ